MFDQKAEMLKGVFFPAQPPADLSDIEGSFYPTSPHCPIIITKSELSTALSRLKSDKAPGPDGISNRILKACSEKLVELLSPLFQACVTHSYHLRAFKMANTIARKKICKGDYTTPKAYRPIALLNTLSKFMESIIGSKITYLAETYRLLPDTQMGARKGRSTESALVCRATGWVFATNFLFRHRVFLSTPNPDTKNHRVHHKRVGFS